MVCQKGGKTLLVFPEKKMKSQGKLSKKSGTLLEAGLTVSVLESIVQFTTNRSYIIVNLSSSLS
ncbi:MAG: hypothetical protein ACP5HX_06030 [Thermoproteota archaeon]|jgi:hypothetical protein